MTLTAIRPTWLAIAERELGVRETRGGETPRILEYFRTTSLRATADEVPWCAAFVGWCLREAGFQPSGSAAAASYLQWGQPAFAPEPGAVVVLRKSISGYSDPRTGSTSGNHVGFFVEATKTSVRLLGGNQHDSVKYSDFPLSEYTVRAVRWPRPIDRATLAASAA